MNTTATRFDPFKGLSKITARPGLIFAIIILTALLAFEMFNYSTTDYALRDLLGDLRFAGIRWSTILAIAFCGIDFAGIARLFTPETGNSEPKEIWYLFGAWMLAATMNALLTWWGVSMAIASHEVASTSVMSAKTLTRVVPIFVALMVWVIRILIIGSLSVAGDRLFNRSERRTASQAYRPAAVGRPVASSPSLSAAPRTAGFDRPRPQTESGAAARSEPSYHSVLLRPRPVPPASLSRKGPASHT